MTKNEKQIVEEVKGVIRGWSFADESGLRSRIIAADIVANPLTGVAKGCANDLIQPVRDALKEELGQ